MIGLSCEDSRIIEDAPWRIVSNSHSDPNKQNDDQLNISAFPLALKRPPALGEKSRRLVTSRHTNQAE